MNKRDTIPAAKSRQGSRSGTTRRTFIKTIGLTAPGLLLASGQTLSAQRLTARMRRRAALALTAQTQAALPGGSLDPTLIPKYASPLFKLPVMPKASSGGAFDYYEIAVRQFSQQVLPAPLPPTTVWGYGATLSPGTVAQGGSFSYPAFTIEAQVNRPVRAKWINDLKDPRTGDYLPHLLPVDQTLHWANPPGPRDRSTLNPARYTGPVPIVTHLHGGHSGDESDGYPEAWYLPAAGNLPSRSFTTGSYYDYFHGVARSKYGLNWDPGTATFQYTNDQAATALWFHDHSLGLVHENVYAGPAGFYLLRGGPGDVVGGELPATELPLMIQDRSFNVDGSLFYPDSRTFFDGFTGPYIPNSDMPPIWNAEYFGNTIVVNGRTWPFLEVEKRRYRFRILNACNTRFLILKFDTGLPNGLPFWQIGGDGGFLPAPEQLDQLLLAPGERADVIVDFSRLGAGRPVRLLNLGPDEPFGGGTPGVDFAPSDPGTTGQVMQFRIVAARARDTSTPPEQLQLPPPPNLGQHSVVRQISFNELDSDLLPGVGPRIGLLGTVDLSNAAAPAGVPLRWMDKTTELPAAGTTEIWEVYDFTEDAHPFHIHQVQFELINREVFDPASPNFGQIRGPEPWETGRKDLAIIYPGEITRFRAHFDLPGYYVWHCHILEHEDNEMMRPFQVTG